MTSPSVSPSAQDWIDAVALDMWEGRRLLVRALPRSGKSWFAERITRTLGETAILVQGRHFTEENQQLLRKSLVEQLKVHVSEHGSAQLVFDDYHRALSRSQGARLQALLYATLVDSPEARDIGAVFFSRQLTPVHLPVRGSPLASRLDPVDLPEWDERDLQYFEVSESASNLSRSIGRSLADLHRFHVGGFAQVVNRLRVDADAIVGDLAADITESLAGLRDLSSASDEAKRYTVGLTYLDDDELRLCDAAREAKLGARVRLTDGWPSDRAGSARAFAELLGGCERALWCDRYLSTDPPRLIGFIRELRQHTQCHLDLLVSDSAGRAPVDLSDLPSVEDDCSETAIRVMTPADRRQLHERHLVRLSEGGGWAIPTFDVVTGKAPVGSAVATQAASFGIDYKEVWNRSTPLARRVRNARRA